MRIASLYRFLVRPALLLLLAGYFLFAVALISLRYLILPSIDDYRPSIERIVSQTVGAPVRIGAIDANWMGLHPRLVLRDVNVMDNEGRVALALPRISALLAWRSVLVMEPHMLQLELEAPELDIRRDAQGRFWAAGISFDPNADDSHQTSRWLLAQGEVSVRGAVVRWVDELRQAPPLELHDVTMIIQNSGRRHRAAVRAVPPAELSSPIDLRADFTHRLLDFQNGDMRRWRGTVYGNLDAVDLAGWRPWLDLPIQFNHGSGAVRGWFDFRRGQFERAVADVALHDVDVVVAPQLPALLLRQVSTRIEAEQTSGGHHISLQQLHLETPEGLIMAPRMLNETWVAASGKTPAHGDLQVQGLDLTTLGSLAASVPLPERVQALVAQTAPKGMLDHLKFTWEGPVTEPVKPEVSAQFSNLALAPAAVPTGKDAHHPQRPGFTGLTGSVQANEDGGYLRVEGRDVVASFPGVFANPDVPLRSLTADVSFERSATGPWTVAVKEARFEHERATGNFHGTWSSHGRTPAGTLELNGGLSRADPREVHRFIPMSVGDDVRNWLRLALLAGTTSDTVFKVKGDLADFPFGDGKSGEFYVGGKFQGVTLDYAGASMGHTDVWPRLEDVAGDFAFDRVSMAVNTSGGKVRLAADSTVALGLSKVRIAHLEKDPLLEVDSEARGAARDFIQFAQREPLSRILGGVLNEASATGNFVTPLSLRIPLKHVNDAQVKGEVQLSGNDFRFDSKTPPFSRLTGTVLFSNEGVALRDVNGSVLDGPVSLSGGPQPDGTDLLQLDGTVTAEGLARFWQVPGMSRFSGQAVYQAKIVIKNGKAPQATLESNLLGLGLDLPEPLQKTQGDILPLRVALGPLEANGAVAGDWLTASLGKLVNVRFESDRDAATGKAVALRGALGINRPATISGPGFGMSVDVPELNADVWKTVLAEFHPPVPARVAAAPAAPPTDAAPTTAIARLLADPSAPAVPEFVMPLPKLSVFDLKTSRFQIHGRTFNDVTLHAARDMASNAQADTGNWRADIDAEQIAGRISWNEGPDGSASRLAARLTRLVVRDEPASAAAAEAELDLRPVDIPEVDLVAEQFELFGKSLGRLEVVANTADRGREWRLRNLSVKNPDADLEGSGVWRLEAADSGTSKRRMSLDATLTLANTGKFLDRMGLPGTMAGGAGKVTAKVSWLGQPYSMDLPSLTGDVELDLGKGQFLKADPGIAKLLGVLSLQSLPRRVSLDFRDIFSEGFAYDTIKAHVTIKNGVAHTDDFHMNGISANVMLAGDTDLVRESQKLRVLVVPKVDAGGASLLYGLAVNPAIGLSVFLAQWLLRGPLGEVLSYQYGISGSWTDPLITRIPLTPPSSGPTVVPGG